MKVKQKVAALLALAMVVTGQPTAMLSDGVAGLWPSYAANEDDVATDNEAKEATPSEIVKNPVEYIIEPEEGASIVKGDKIVKTRGELTFTVEVNDGYELDSVDVDGDSVEPAKVDENEYSYSYQMGDILFEDHTTEVTVTLNEVEEVPFSDTVTTGDGLFEFEITADAGVLPEGTEVQVISLADEDEAYADQIKEEVLAEAKVEEEAEPQYAAYRIEFVNEEGEVLSDDEINGKVEVSVAMAEDEEAELAVYKVEGEATEAVEETPVTYGLAAPRRAAAKNNVEPKVDVEEVKTTFSLTKSNANVAVLAAPQARTAILKEEITLYPGQSIMLGDDSVKFQNDWYFSDTNGNKEDGLEGINLTDAILNYHHYVSVERDIASYNEDIFNQTVYIAHKYSTKVLSDTNDIDIYPITIKMSNAYFYVKKAAFANGGDAGSSPENYEYWGIGYIPLGEPRDYQSDWPMDEGWVWDGWIPHWESEYAKKSLDNESWHVIEPTERADSSAARYDSEGYPILYLGRTPYYYEESQAQEATESENKYAIEWSVYTLAEGAQNEFGTSITDELTWHVDGDVVLYNESQIQISAYLQNFETEDEPELIMADLVDKDDPVPGWKILENQINAIESFQHEGYEIVWYTDSSFTTPYTDSWLISEAASADPKEGINVYGRYEDAKNHYTVSYDANGGSGTVASQTAVEGSNVTLSDGM